MRRFTTRMRRTPAHTGAVWHARGLKAITASNHVIGEMMSLVIIHEAIGGKKLEYNERNPEATRPQDQSLDWTYRIARPLHRLRELPAYKTVRQKGSVQAGATLRDSKRVLKELLVKVYQYKILGKLLQLSGYPPFVIAGRIMWAAAHIAELKILQEYKTLNVLHRIARSLLVAKRIVRNVMLPAAKRYTDDVVNRVPTIAWNAAAKISSRNGHEGSLFPRKHPLPVMLDPHARAKRPRPHASTPSGPGAPAQVDRSLARNIEVRQPNGSAFPAIYGNQPTPTDLAQQHRCGCPSVRADNMRDQLVKTSQLARASFPWVNYHRQPILRALKLLVPWSKAHEFYFDHTNGFSKRLCDRFQRHRNEDSGFTNRRQPRDAYDMGLYVMESANRNATYEFDKGYELWNLPQYSEVADRLFTVVGLTYQPPVEVVGISIFGQAHPEGTFAYAQAMVYNANDQTRSNQRINLRCKRIVPVRQANVGWDTLNWYPGGGGREGCRSKTTGNGSARNNVRPFELVGIGIPHQYPRIHVNWQAKLVPGSQYRLQQIAAGYGVDSRFRPLTRQLSRRTPTSLRTH
ncbi:MAG: hypothetical protein O3A00_27100 [Planctomycetota bacterium]|nr:hypothetical protein [Planctomycetota bacterium]